MPGERCRVCGGRVPAGSRCGLRWGWVAVLYCESGGQWCRVGEAARAAGTSAAVLRHWSARGLISAVHHPGRHRRYYRPELLIVAEIADTVGLASGEVLAAHVDHAMQMGWR